MTNLPILYQNIIYGLPDEYAVEAFLWFVERPNQDRFLYRAEAFAREASDLRKTVEGLIWLTQRSNLRTGGHVINREQEFELVNFIMTRHANYRTGGNAKPDYCARAAAE